MGKWTSSESWLFVTDHEFNKYQFGEISVLVSKNQLNNFFVLEALCNDAIMSIPYEQLNVESQSVTYAELRDKIVAQLQYIRLKLILKNLLGSDIWIEVPNGHSDQDLCKKKVI